MSGVMSLKELQAENKAQEDWNKEGKEKPKEVTEDVVPEVAEPAEEKEPEVEATEEQVDDAWMKPEGEETPKFTDSDAAAIRRKYKSQVQEKNEENESLRKEIEELKKKVSSPAVESVQAKPKREQFVTEDEYLEALTDYKIALSTQRSQSEQSAAAAKQRQEEMIAATTKAVDAHYERGAKLAEKSGIKPEAYQAADKQFRSAIEGEFPKAGDAIADALIASLGAGSEKVTFNLGVNATRRAEFVKLLREDKSGIRAAAYLGEIKALLNAPAKRQTTAPDPIDDIRGDKAGGVGSAEKMRRDYKTAHAKGDVQAAFNIRRAAKNKKIDTSKW